VNELRNFAAVLAAARRGDDAAMAVLFRSVHPRLLRFVRAQESRWADDLVGEIWMAVAKGLANFTGDEAAFRAWVFSIARRRIADHRRKGMRRNTNPHDPASFQEVVAPDRTEDIALGQLSGQRAADLIVATLPPEHAEVILLRVLADLDADEVAAMMGKSANWVRVTQHRALKRLAERIGTKLDVTP
jgi:RNA polymerase sigma-70 factor, ECF subfamily